MIPPSPRTGRALFDASKPFALENQLISWLHVGSTLSVLTAAIAVAVWAPWWPLRALGAVVEGLVVLRVFILYHDHMHGALLRRSSLAAGIFGALGVLMLCAPRVWKDTHGIHHANTGRLSGPPIGTYVLWTVEQWHQATWFERLIYRLERHPLNMLFGHVTVFFLGMCVLPFVKRPIRYASSGLAALAHVVLAGSLLWAFGFSVLLFAMLIPFFTACAIGSYLFYVQHNADGVLHCEEDAWQHTESALAGSSYLWTDPLMRWFSGNIGYHHVHHLNVRIPFYRLPKRWMPYRSCRIRRPPRSTPAT